MVSLVGFAKPGGFGRNRNHLVSFGFETETMVSLDHYSDTVMIIRRIYFNLGTGVVGLSGHKKSK